MVELFFGKFVDYLIVTLLEMESTLTILLQVFLKVTNIDFFVYKTTGFIMWLILILLIDFFTTKVTDIW